MTVGAIALAGLLLPNQTSAQFTGNNQTNVIDGTAVNWPSNYYVGSNYASEALFITNGGFLSSSNAYIGLESGANSNLATVSTSGSLWTNWGFFYVGYNGSYNQLVISDGGRVETSGSIVRVGYQSGSTSNSVLVTDSGSLWHTADLQIGNTGSHSSMVISNGGVVSSLSGILGENPGLNSNIALVTGSGSMWSNTSLYVGHGGSGNALVASNGGALFSSVNGGLGATSISTNNSILITGSGSIWKNAGTIFVWGLNNRLTITNGGSVLGTNFDFGFVTGTYNNLLEVSGGSLTVTNSSGTGFLNVRGGVLTFNGGTINLDQLLWLTNAIFQFNSGTIHTKGTTVSNTQPCVVGDGVGSGNFHLVGGAHSFQNGLRIRPNSFLTGCGTVNGSVVIDVGGAVHANCTNLVFNSPLTNNGTMVVDGAVLETFGLFVNNGKVYLLNGATTNFHGTFVNNGSILNGKIPITIARDGSNGSFVRYTGAPDVSYRLQRAANVTGPWIDIVTNTAPASGLVEHHETAPPPTKAFYRTVQP